MNGARDGIRTRCLSDTNRAFSYMNFVGKIVWIRLEDSHLPFQCASRVYFLRF